MKLQTWAKTILRNLWILLLPLPFGLQRMLASHSVWVEQVYVRQIFPVISAPLRILSSIPPFSVTEMVTILSPVLLVALLYFFWRAIRRKRLLAWIKAVAVPSIWILTAVAWLFILLHGLNYVREPVAQSFALPVRERSAAELAAAAYWVIDQATTARQACGEDPAGIFQLQTPIKTTLDQANAGFQIAAKTWPLLKGAKARPKSVWLSHFWSYTGITGVYLPLLVEANVNTDQPEYLLPATADHELAHTIGFAREDEAGFVGYLAGISSPYPDYRYSSYADATVRLLNSLMATNADTYAAVAKVVPAPIWRDIAAANDYWQQFAGPVQETSNQINNAYLQANLQTDGVYSYGRMVDLLLAWYEQNNQQQTLPEALPS
jgi:hypothetical protein